MSTYRRGYASKPENNYFHPKPLSVYSARFGGGNSLADSWRHRSSNSEAEFLRAPLAALYLLAQGPENRVDDISAADAARGLLSCILFFAEDAELVQAVFRSALDFVERVPVRRLTFVPDARVWELIG